MALCYDSMFTEKSHGLVITSIHTSSDQSWSDCFDYIREPEPDQSMHEVKWSTESIEMCIALTIRGLLIVASAIVVFYTS